MRRLAGLVMALAAVVACGKSRVVDDAMQGGEPMGGGFHLGADSACDHACIAKRELDRPKHAVRTSPEARVVATLEEPSRVGLVFWHESCLEGASLRDWESGWWWCLDPRDATSHVIAHHGPPSAMTRTTTSVYLATRDVNGRSSIQSGKTVLAAGETDVRALAAHGDDVCWIDASERVRCVEERAVRTVARAPGIDARFLAMDGDAFHVVRGGWIARLTRGQGRLSAVARIESPIHDLVLADGRVYWTEEGEPRIECLADGTMPKCTARGRVIRHPFGSLHRLDIATGATSVIARDLDDVDGLAVGKEHVYVSTRRGLVRVAAKGEVGSPTVLPTRDPAFGRPALDPVSWTVYVQTRKEAGPTTVVAFPP